MTKEINCVFTMGGTYYLNERSVLAAHRKAKENLPLPEDRDYLDDSLVVDDLGECMEANGWDCEEIEELSKMSAETLTALIDARVKNGVESTPDGSYTTTRLKEFLLDYHDILYPGFQPEDYSDSDETPAEEITPQPSQAPSQEDTCYVMIYRNYAGKAEVLVCGSKAEAAKRMSDGVEVITDILTGDGYTINTTVKNDHETEVTTQDGALHWEWKIYPATKATAM